VTLETEDGETLSGQLTEEGHCAFIISAGQRVTLHWKEFAGTK